MRVAIVGATGVLGRYLLPLLPAADHTVRALARTPEQAQALAAVGVEPVAGDLLAADAAERLPALVAGCDAVVHIATAIPANSAAPRAWAANTRLRTDGTRLLLAATLAAGVPAYIQQSIVMAYPDSGDRWLDKATPLDTNPARASVVGPVAIMEGLVRAVALEQLRWCILRGGAFVGPGTAQEGTLVRLRAGTERGPLRRARLLLAGPRGRYGRGGAAGPANAPPPGPSSTSVTNRSARANTWIGWPSGVARPRRPTIRPAPVRRPGGAATTRRARS